MMVWIKISLEDENILRISYFRKKMNKVQLFSVSKWIFGINNMILAREDSRRNQESCLNKSIFLEHTKYIEDWNLILRNKLVKK